MPSNTQAAPLPAQSGNEATHVSGDDVNVVFTVSDGSGRFVNKLSLNDLNVLDNRRAPERVNYFQQQSDLPLRVAVLVDLNHCVAERFAYQKKAAIAFLQTVLRPQVDQALFMGFASDLVLYQDFTSDVGALANAVREVCLGGDARLYDAIQFASAKLGYVAGPQLVRRVIIVIADGKDSRSRAIMYDAIQSALRAETTVFALSSNDSSGSYTRAEAVLELITRPTGGRVLRARNKSEIATAFDKVKDALRNQYAIGYKPADFKPDGTFRTMEILPRHSKLRVQCRRGYYAPEEPPESAVSANQ